MGPRRGAGAVLFENPAEGPEGAVQSGDHAREVFVPALRRSRGPLEVGKPRLQFRQHPCASRVLRISLKWNTDSGDLEH